MLLDQKSPYLRSLLINKGFKHGIKLGAAVRSDSFFIGKIVDSNYLTSRILLISDLNSKIPVDILPNNIQSILSGTGGDIGKIQYIKEEALIENESVVYTSGAGGIFKPGVPIGRTVKNNLNSEINVEFYSEFSQLRFVKLRSYKAEEN